MSYIVLIRESTPQDAPHINELVKNAYITNVNEAWCNALFKEITFQLIVVTAAIMFIFLGVPLLYCLAALPVVMLLIYMAVYVAFFTKAMEVITSKRAIKCWVAEVYLPYFFARDARLCSFDVVFNEGDIVDVGNFQKKIVGTVALMNNLHSPHSGWLFRFAVDGAYRKKGIGKHLVKTLLDYCKRNGYLDVQLAVSECQENARQMLADCGFQLRLMYHKQLIGSALTLLMYHLECALELDL